MLDDIYMQILDMTKIGSIVILVVLLARLLLKRAPKVFSYALWAVVLFRLLCPVSFFETPVSLLPEVTPVSQSYSLNDEPISVLEAGNAAYNAVGDALNGGLGIQRIDTTDLEPDGSYRTVTTDWYDVWILFGQYVWVAGVAGMLLHSAVSYWKLRKRIAVVIPLRENIFLADDIESPFVVGLIHPKIYLPSNLSEKEQSYIILHEQHHIRRCDHIIKALAFLALCLHWFNPLVWVAFAFASKDMEMSCDEAVIRKMGENVRADYSASLLTLATGRRIIAGTPLAFGEGDPKGRIRNLAKWKKPAFWVIVIAVLVCIVLAVCLLTDPMAREDVGRTYYFGTVVQERAGLLESDGTNRSIITVACNDGTERTFWIWDIEESLEDWNGKTVMLRGDSDAETGISFAHEVNSIDPVVESNLDEAIHAAIRSYNGRYHDKEMLPCTSYVELAREGSFSDQVTVYGLALYQSYRVVNGALSEESGSHVPVALTFHITDSGEYILTEYWEPRDGIYYSDDIRAKFPLLVWPDTQEHIVSQVQNCYVQAVEHFGVDTDSIVADLLDQITPVNTTFPDLQYHSEENTIEYREMIYYGKYTLEYCFREFMKGGQTDLRGDIMAQVCREIMAEWGEKTVGEKLRGQDWFSVFADNARMLRQRYSDDVLQERYPAAWIYLQMSAVSSSATANGFEIKLYSDQARYTTDEEIQIWATLEYQGEGDTVTIWHGIPYISFSITDGADFVTGGMVATILTSSTLDRGEVYRFEYAKSGGYDPAGPNADFWTNFYQEEALRLPAGTYTVSVSGAFSISEQQRPGEGGPSCELQITVTE